MGTWFVSSLLAARHGLHLVRTLQVGGFRGWPTALVGDWDGDGTPDLYAVRDHSLMVVSTEGEILAERPLSLPSAVPASLHLVADLEKDGRDEAFCNWAQDRSMCIDVIGARNSPLMRFEAEGNTLEGKAGAQHTSSLTPLGLYDLDGTGHRDLLAVLAAGYEMKPRGICCFDLAGQTMKWRYLTAARVQAVAVGDLTGDGVSEIAVGNYSPGNGAVLEDGSDDSHSHLFVLDIFP